MPQSIINKYKAKQISTNLYGFVGPIVGVSGVLLGLSSERKIPAISFLAETFGHPTHLGIKGAREILGILDDRFKLKLNLKELDGEISEMEEKGEDIENFLKDMKSKLPGKKDTTYIG